VKAIVQDRYGDVDVLEFRDIDQPVPKDDEVLVRVQAAGLHRGDWHVMTGQADLQVLRELVEAGKLTPVVGRTYPLGEVPEAIRQMVEGRGGGGKIVITV
jgi:NADPH:quinone reductase-like Zn-dependent oxidoreductase